MHFHHDRFMLAVSQRKIVKLTVFTSESESPVTVKRCVPLWYDSPEVEGTSGAYCVWDLQANAKDRFLELPVWQVLSVELLEETFDPAAYYSIEPQ